MIYIYIYNIKDLACMHACMHAWMSGCMHGCMDGFMDVCMYKECMHTENYVTVLCLDQIGMHDILEASGT